MNKVERQQKKDLAYSYKLKGLKHVEIANLLGITKKTIDNWSTAEKWKEKISYKTIAQTCLTLRNEGKKLKDIAKLTNKTEPTIRKYIRAAKEKEINTQNK